MSRPRICEAYHKMEPEEGSDEGDDNRKTEAPTLREFMENFMTSLPSIVRAFPKGNMDVAALEAHYWDWLQYFYSYESFGMCT